MFFTTRMNSIILMLFLAALVGSIILQIYLSNKRSFWPGLILPLFALLWSVARLFMVQYFEMTSLEIAGAYLSRFLLENIPTYFLLALYFACRIRNKRKKQKMLDKMNLHDLH